MSEVARTPNQPHRRNHSTGERGSRRRAKSQSLRKQGPSSPGLEAKSKGKPREKVPPGEPIPLEHRWTFWFDGKANVGMQAQDYSKSVMDIGSFDNIQDFWRYWNNIEPWKFAVGANLRLFKDGIKPMWEDKANVNGGRWVLQCDKRSSNIPLGRLVLALIGEQFYKSEKLCGVVFQVRGKFDLLSLWTSVAEPDSYIEKMMAQIKAILELPNNCPIGFVLQRGSIKWNKDRSSELTTGVAHKRNPSLDSSLARRLTVSEPESQQPRSAPTTPYYFASPSTISLTMSSKTTRRKSPSGGISSSSSPSPSCLATSSSPLDTPSPSTLSSTSPLPPATDLDTSEQDFSTGATMNHSYSQELSATIHRIRSGGSLNLLEEENDPEVEKIAISVETTRSAPSNLTETDTAFPHPTTTTTKHRHNNSNPCVIFGAATTVVVGVAATAILAANASGMLDM